MLVLYSSDVRKLTRTPGSFLRSELRELRANVVETWSDLVVSFSKALVCVPVDVASVEVNHIYLCR